MSPVEAKEEDKANKMIENSLSSVEIIKNSKGYNWSIKVKNENAYRCETVALAIDKDLREKLKV